MKAKTLLIVVVAALLTVLAVPVTSAAAFAMEPVTGIEILHNDRISQFDEAVLEDTVVLIYDDSPDVQDPLEEEAVEDCYALILYKEEGLICKSFFITGATTISDSDLELAYNKAVEIRTRLNEIVVGTEDILPPPDAGQDAIEFPVDFGDDGFSPYRAQRCFAQDYTYIHSYEDEKYGQLNLRVLVYYLDVEDQRLFFIETCSNLVPGAGAASHLDLTPTSRSEGYEITIKGDVNSAGLPVPRIAQYWPQYEAPEVTITSGFSSSITLGTMRGYSGSISTDAFGVGATGEFETVGGMTYHFSATYTAQTPLYTCSFDSQTVEGPTILKGAWWDYYQFYVTNGLGFPEASSDVREKPITLYNGIMLEAQKTNAEYELTFNVDMDWLMMTPGFLGILDDYAMVRTFTGTLTVPACE